jgi:hypothetical protein
MIYLYKKFTPSVEIKKIQADFSNAEFVRITDQIQDVSEIQSLIESSSLFSDNRIVIMSDMPRDFWDDIIESLHHVPDTTTLFWFEDSFPVAYTKKIPKYTLKENEEKKASAVVANPFQIANALPSGNATTIWVTYQELLDQGSTPEELFGILWWKLKDIAKKQKISSPEFKTTLHNFLSAYARARETGGNLESGLEQVLLSLTKKDLI